MEQEDKISEEEVEEVEEVEVQEGQDKKKKKKSKRGGKEGKVERGKKIVKNDYAAVKRWRKKNPEKVSEYQKKHWKPKYKTCSNEDYMKPESPSSPGAAKQKKPDKE